ncbi:MAG: hypothetical protein Ct9H300mP12_04010 [Acidimicrobiales bacterium]|nr:MAG: hypothetical protein Ct9H300mP12_04010 [Acidimicrobiales bacterium]
MSEPQQYWTNLPHATSRPGEVSLLLPDVDLRLTTDRGVFSADRIDRGTRFLLLDGPRHREVRWTSWTWVVARALSLALWPPGTPRPGCGPLM